MKRPLRNALCHAAIVALAAAGASVASAQTPRDNHYILCVKAGRCVDQMGTVPSPVETSIGRVGSITTDSLGNVYFSAPNLIYRLGVDGGITRVAGSTQAGYAGDGGPAVDAQLNYPTSYPELERPGGWMDFSELVGALTTDASGNLYVADAYNNRVRKIDMAGIITTVAGDGTRTVGESGPAVKGGVWWPQGVAVDAAGKLYIADPNGLRAVGLDGNISLLHRSNCGPGYLGPGLCAPQGIAIDGQNNVLVPDVYCRVRLYKPGGSNFTIAGADYRPDPIGTAFTCGYSGDGGPAVNAVLGYGAPYAVAVGSDGGVYIADTANSCIRKVDATGIITRFAGTCKKGGFSGDGGPATSALLGRPFGVATDTAGNVYIADTANARIRKVSPDGVITTVAGNGGPAPTALAETSTPTPATVPVVEFFNAALDHYFMTWHAKEIAILDAGVQITGWRRTGYSLSAYPAARTGTSDICRFLITQGGKDSHFYGRGADECAATRENHPDYVLEDPQFMAMKLPVAGICPTNTTEVYRVYNNRPDANHRYMTDKAVRSKMIDKGWVAEGDGADAVVMCAPR